MTPEMIHTYWSAVLRQDADEMYSFFTEDATILWHNTNEQFTAEEFVHANCIYPGNWDGNIEKLILLENLVITVTHVFSTDKQFSFHVTSFFQINNGKISAIDEYWGDDGDVPQWRRELKIGKKIK